MDLPIYVLAVLAFTALNALSYFKLPAVFCIANTGILFLLVATEFELPVFSVGLLLINALLMFMKIARGRYG